jgi:heptosyltransferase-2
LPGWVGDAVMATPALRALRQHFTGAELVGVLKPKIAGVLEGAPWLDHWLFLERRGPFRHRWPAVAWRLRQQHVDLAVLFPNSFRSALVAWLGGCRQRIGHVRYGRGPLLTSPLQPVRDHKEQLVPSPAIDAYNRLAETAGCPRPSYRMELFTTSRDEHAADQVWAQARLHAFSEVVCLNPGAAFGAAKHWPAVFFAELARTLAERRGSGVLVLCGPAERDLARQIASLAHHPAVYPLSDHPLSLGLTKACVRRCDLLVTTDSGPRHVGVAFDRPVLTLFGPTHIAWTETYHPKSVHLQRQVPCGPCQLRVCPLDHRCMRELGPTEVFTAANELLQRFPPASRRGYPAGTSPTVCSECLSLKGSLGEPRP